jgi:hypothetical protein
MADLDSAQVHTRQPIEKVNRVVDISRVFHNEFIVWQKIYDEIEKGYQWLAGEQYTLDEISWYESQRRPVNVFNLLFPHVNTVMGDFLENDDRERVFPKGQADPGVAAALEDVLDHIHFNNDAKTLEAETLLAALVKMGWTYTRFSNEKEIGGSIVIGNVDEMEIMFDSRAKDYFLDDAKYLLRSRWLTTDDILNLWPHHRRELKQILTEKKESTYYDGIADEIHAMMNHHDFVMESQGKYRIIEFHEIEYQSTQVAYNPLTRDRLIYDYDKDPQRAERFIAANPQYKIVDSNEKIKNITNIIPGLAFELEHKKADVQDQQFDYQPLFAYHYGKKTIDNFGIFKNSFDPQREFNDWHNRTADIINKTANQTVGMKPNSLLNPREVENYGAMTGGIVKFKDDADPNKDYVRYPTQDFPRGSDVMQREAMEMIPKILGITPNQMGFSESKQEPAQLFGMRVRQATKALSVIYNNLSRSRVRRSNKILKLIQHYYQEPHIFKILVKEEMTQREVAINMQYGDQIINDVTLGTYEVVFDDVERNPTARALRWELKNQLVQLILSNFGPTAIDPEWWLQDSDLGDVKQLIERINLAIYGMVQDGQQQEAFDAADRLIAAANQSGIPLKQQGSAQNKQPANTSQGNSQN